jgi:hypothetical protein
MGVSGQRQAPAALYRRGKDPGAHWIGGWVGPRAGLDTEARGKVLFSPPGIETTFMVHTKVFQADSTRDFKRAGISRQVSEGDYPILTELGIAGLCCVRIIEVLLYTNFQGSLISIKLALFEDCNKKYTH